MVLYITYVILGTMQKSEKKQYEDVMPVSTTTSPQDVIVTEPVNKK